MSKKLGLGVTVFAIQNRNIFRIVSNDIGSSLQEDKKSEIIKKEMKNLVIPTLQEPAIIHCYAYRKSCIVFLHQSIIQGASSS